MEPRFFYHSFPRKRRGESDSEAAIRGMAILRSIKDLGLLLAPEVVEWRTPASLGVSSPIRVMQKRICFTELARSELALHSSRFGPFALEFSISELRRMGALPTIYMPQALLRQDQLAMLGPFVVSHLDQIRGALENLAKLSQFTDVGCLQQLGANAMADDCVANLKNVDQSGQTIQEFQIPWNAIRDLLRFIGFESAPFDAMIGATSITQSLFYPTDNEHQDAELGYYRQREWRITADYSINGSPRGRELQSREIKRLLEIDQQFWGAKTHESEPTPRARNALLLRPRSLFGQDYESFRVVVPGEYSGQACEVFGNRIIDSSQI